MAFLVDEGNGYLQPADDMNHALDLAGHALAAADDFARRMGWAPFWADAVQILTCSGAGMQEWWRYPVEMAKRSKVRMTADQVRRKLGMPPCPAARPEKAVTAGA